MLMNYAPHAPTQPDPGRDHRDRIATRSKPGAAGSVTLDKGAADGLDVGTVLAIYRVIAADARSANHRAPGRRGRSSTCRTAELKVPDERIGLVFVFRVFDRVSYALVLNTTDPVVVGNYARNP